MNSLIAAYNEELQEICRRYHVRRLELFGSAAQGEFDPSVSDLDFLVEFEDFDADHYADMYFGLLESLEALFQHPVDLVMPSAITNPYFLESVDRSRVLLYAA